MPSYVWRCLACGVSNLPAATRCAECECSATPTVAAIEEARRTHPDLPGVKQQLAEKEGDRINPFEIIGLFFWPVLAFIGLWPWRRRKK